MINNRLYYIDWLRILAVLALFPFHTGEIFSPRFFYVKSEVLLNAPTFFNSFMYHFHMPLFMFLAGIGSYFALKHRDGKGYVLERFKRLFVPLLFGILVVIPPQSYLRLLGKAEMGWPKGFIQNAPAPGYDKNFFEFYPDFFNAPFPHGNLEWGHLWFLAYLFTFSLIVVKLFLYFKSDKGKTFIDKIASFADKKYGIFIFILPIAFFEITLRWKFPGMQNLIADWTNFMTYIFVFISGYIIMSDDRFIKSIGRNWKFALTLGVVLDLVLSSLYMAGFNNDNMGTGFYILSQSLKAITMWCMLIGLMGIGKSVLNHKGRFMTYVREAALPFYILHQTAVLVVGFYVLQLAIPAGLQYFVIIIFSFIASLLVYEIIIRRFFLMRFCFGMKMRK